MEHSFSANKIAAVPRLLLGSELQSGMDRFVKTDIRQPNGTKLPI